MKKYKIIWEEFLEPTPQDILQKLEKLKKITKLENKWDIFRFVIDFFLKNYKKN